MSADLQSVEACDAQTAMNWRHNGIYTLQLYFLIDLQTDLTICVDQ